MRAHKRTYQRIAISVAVCLLIGALSGFATQSSVATWYPELAKPGFTPPNWLFAPIWTALYISMGIAAGLVWARGLHHAWVKTALYYFGFQLLVNGSWSVVFFGLRNPGAALWVIGLLLTLIILTIKTFRVASKPAAWLLVPYLVWVLFASMLNLSIVQLN